MKNNGKHDSANNRKNAPVLPIHLGAPLRKELGNEVYNYISLYVNLEEPETEVLEAPTKFNIENLDAYVTNIINIKDMNFVLSPNIFLKAINQHLPYGGLFIGKMETCTQRRAKILGKFLGIISYPISVFDHFFNAILPKWYFTKRLYYFFTKGEYSIYSKSEILGKLLLSGFDIIDDRVIDGRLYFVVKKIRNANVIRNKKYGFFYKVKKVGKDGKTFEIFKFRTMYPYSEFLTEYMYKKYNLKDNGKFENDFRITTTGRFLRKFKIDRLPVLLNWVKGDVKLVGVQPLSKQYFGLYPKDLKELRTKVKPGLVPPFFNEMPNSLPDLFNSERRYLEEYFKHPFRTDVKYFFKAFSRIVLGNVYKHETGKY